jgi:hypothetical protein
MLPVFSALLPDIVRKKIFIRQLAEIFLSRNFSFVNDETKLRR